MAWRWLDNIKLNGQLYTLYKYPNATQPSEVPSRVNAGTFVDGYHFMNNTDPVDITQTFINGGSKLELTPKNRYNYGTRVYLYQFYINNVSFATDESAWIDNCNNRGFGIMVDDDNHFAWCCLCGTYSNGDGYFWNGMRGAAADWYTWVTGVEPIIYNWDSWSAINGNNGQYRCNLTKLKHDSIGDFSSEINGDATDFELISAQSDIWGDFQNMSFGDEKILAWSGDAYMTFKITAESQMPNYANFIFKFYSNQNDLLLTFTKLVKWNGVDNSIAFYLSFVYDNVKQAALFNPIIKMSDNSTYKWGYNNFYDESDMLYLWLWLQMSSAGEDSRPYDTGTTDDGGQPTGDILTNDDMPTVVVPTISAMQTGLFTVYCPDDTELEHIATFLWSDNLIDNFKKYFNNFSDNIISLYVLPYKPSNLPTKGFKVGGLDSTDLALASVEYVTSRFVTLDMGEVNVGDVWDSYLDFAPYTRFNIYLPGIGVQALDADDIMAPLDKNKNFGAKLGSKITLEYALDLMTGICVAYIKINGQIRYQFSGKLGYQIPLTGENYSSILHAFSVASTGLVSTLATGGAAAPFAATSAVTAITNAMKPDVYRGGNLSGNAASISYPTPYLIRRIPNKPELVNQDKFTGFQSYKSGKLRDFGGYTEVVEVHAEGFVCTEEERSEIIELLKKGVIL